MNIVLPIVFFAVIVGLFVPEEHLRKFRWLMALWIMMIMAYYWIKH